MELTINKERIAKTINELPEDTTIEEAIDQLVLLHKVEMGMKEAGEMSQKEIEHHFQQRREKRNK